MMTKKPEGIRWMRELKKSKKTPQPGQVFYCSVQGGENFWGRFVKAVDNGRSNIYYLVYLYSYCTSNLTPPIDAEWKFEDLLIPPFFELKNAWLYGKFEFINQIVPITEEERNRIHYFRHPMWAYPQGAGKTLNEYDNEVIPPLSAVISLHSSLNLASLAEEIDKAFHRDHLYDYYVDGSGNTIPNPNKTTE